MKRAHWECNHNYSCASLRSRCEGRKGTAVRTYVCVYFSVCSGNAITKMVKQKISPWLLRLCFILLDRLNRKWLVLKLHRCAIKEETRTAHTHARLLICTPFDVIVMCVINAFNGMNISEAHTHKRRKRRTVLRIENMPCQSFAVLRNFFLPFYIRSALFVFGFCGLNCCYTLHNPSSGYYHLKHSEFSMPSIHFEKYSWGNVSECTAAMEKFASTDKHSKCCCGFLEASTKVYIDVKHIFFSVHLTLWDRLRKKSDRRRRREQEKRNFLSRCHPFTVHDHPQSSRPIQNSNEFECVECTWKRKSSIFGWRLLKAQLQKVFAFSVSDGFDVFLFVQCNQMHCCPFV